MTNRPSGRSGWVVGLLVVETFNLISATGGGIALALTGGLGMPLSVLSRSPFDSFTWPGVILATVVGGTQAIAMALALSGHRFALAAAAVAAFGMIGWIYVEVSMLLFYHWLQSVYFVTGTAQLVIVLVLLGVLRSPGFVRTWPPGRLPLTERARPEHSGPPFAVVWTERVVGTLSRGSSAPPSLPT